MPLSPLLTRVPPHSIGDDHARLRPGVRTRFALFAAVVAVLLAGCGSTGSSDAMTTSADSGSPTVVQQDVTVGPVSVLDTQIGVTPKVVVKPGAPVPETLTTEDLILGTGPEVVPTDSVTANYVGVGLNTGKVFDSSFDRGSPAPFPLANVIAGWQQGIPGMQVGGRRLLVIPADLAYGANPPPGSGIEPNEPLAFVVDLVSVP